MIRSLLYSPHFRRAEQLLVLLTTVVYGGCVLLVASQLTVLDDFMVRGAIAFILVQASVQALLIVGLVVGKRVRTRLEETRALRMRTIEGLLAAPDSSGEILALAAQWPGEFLSVVEAALQSLAGSTWQRVASLLEASPAYRRLLRESSESDPGRVIQALALLGKLHCEAARDAVNGCLAHSASAVRRAARKAVATGGDEQLRGQVLQAMSELPAWERLVLFPLFPWDGVLQGFLNESLGSQDERKVLVALEMVLTRQRVLISLVPARLSESASLEVRIKFFRALPFLRLDTNPNLALESGLKDPDWRVRASAARACGVLRASHFAGRLLEMCRSFENSAEAGHAARALAAFGAEGWMRLQEAASGGTDESNQIAAEVMERRMVGREGGR